MAAGDGRVVVERRGKPFVALVSIDDLEHIELVRPHARRPLGALALVGAWQELDESEIDGFVDKVYCQRLREPGRPVAEFG